MQFIFDRSHGISTYNGNTDIMLHEDDDDDNDDDGNDDDDNDDDDNDDDDDDDDNDVAVTY